MCFGFQHDDGWFAVAAALSDAISKAAPTAQVTGWKAKFAQLSVWLDSGNARCDGAIEAASNITQRISERSGKPGRPMFKPRSVKVLAPDESADWLPADPMHDWLEQEWTTPRLRARHPSILAHAEIALPRSTLFLVDAFLESLPEGTRLAKLALHEGAQAANGTLLSPSAQGAADFLMALVPRLHGETGSIGPVDDTGQLIPDQTANPSGKYEMKSK